jgi:hypothetical protein
MNAVESTVQLQIRMPSSMRQAVKIEAAMREVRVCRFVQEAIKEKIARDRAAAVPTEPAAVAQYAGKKEPGAMKPRLKL